MPLSQNGWAVVSSAALTVLSWVTGRVRPGDVWVVFDYLCRRFNAEVETIIPAASWGYALRDVRGSTDTSNHASGTAIDLNAPKHVLGRRGTFTTAQVAAIRRILADLDGVIRWGGDYTGRPDEMHFEVNASASRLAAVAARIRAGATAVSNPVAHTGTDIPTPAGSPLEPLTPEDPLMPLTDAEADALKDDARQSRESLTRIEAMLGPTLHAINTKADTLVTGLGVVSQNVDDVEGGVAAFPALVAAVAGRDAAAIAAELERILPQRSDVQAVADELASRLTRTS